MVFYHTFGRFKPIYEQVTQPFYLAANMLLENIENTSLFSSFEIALFYSLASSKYLCGGAKYFWFTQSISRQHTYNAKHVWDQIFQFQETHLRNFRCMFLKLVYENSVTSSTVVHTLRTTAFFKNPYKIQFWVYENPMPSFEEISRHPFQEK